MKWLDRLFRREQKLEPAFHLSLQEGDALVFEMEDHIPEAGLAYLKENLKERFPGVQIIVLGKGIQLRGVVRGPGPFIPQPRGCTIS